MTPHHYINAVVPHIYVEDAEQAIAFYGRAFGPTELFCIRREDGTILHAELSIADSILMIGDSAHPAYGTPRTLGACTAQPAFDSGRQRDPDEWLA